MLYLVDLYLTDTDQSKYQLITSIFEREQGARYRNTL